jgi:hypothetical protein
VSLEYIPTGPPKLSSSFWSSESDQYQLHTGNAALETSTILNPFTRQDLQKSL